MCQSLTRLTRLTHYPYTVKIARIRYDTMISSIFKCEDVHTISVYIKCQGVQRYNTFIRGLYGDVRTDQHLEVGVAVPLTAL